MENLFGIWKDGRPVNAVETYKVWEHAKNILINDNFKSIANEKGFKIDTTFSKEIIGIIPTNKGHVVFSTNNNTSDIHFVQNKIKTNVVIDSVCLGFRLDKPIEGIFKFNDCGDLIVVFTDNHNSIKIINITKLIEDPPSSFICKNYKLFQDVERVNVSETVKDGGNLTSGAYSLFYSFINEDGRETKNSYVYDPIFITNSNISDGHESYDGVESNTKTNKSISYIINPINNVNNYVKIKLGVIVSINNIKRAYHIVTLDVMPIVSYNFTGNENLKEVDLTNVLVNNISYETAKTITEINDEVYLGNLKSNTYGDFQKYVNNFKVQWYSKIINPNEFKNSSKVNIGNHIEKSFMPREVYAMYFFFNDKKGNTSPFYHIPGPSLTANDRLQSSILLTGFPSNPLKYEIEDTCKLTFASTTNLNTESIAFGDMGKWENKTENYEDVACSEIWNSTGKIGELNNTKVRHHRFPSLNYLSKNMNSPGKTGNSIGLQEDVILGVLLSNLHFPTEIRDNMASWGIAFAKRDIDNMTVYGQDMLLYSSLTKISTFASPERLNNYAEYTSAGINSNFNDGLDGDSELNNTYIRGHNADLLKDLPDISPDYIANELDIKADYSDNDYYIYDYTKYQYERYTRNVVIDHTKKLGFPFIGTVNAVDSNRLIRNIEDFSYFPNHVFINSMNYTNLYKESFIHIKPVKPVLNDNLLSIDLDDNLITILDTKNGDLDPGEAKQLKEHHTTKYSICKLLNNVYVGYNNQKDVIILDDLQTPSPVVSGPIFGGDTFVSMNTITTHINRGELQQANNTAYAEMFLNDGSLTINLRRLNFFCFFINSFHTINNWGLRHQELDNDLTQYYPKDSRLFDLNASAIYSQDINDSTKNWITAYNEDYSTVNIFNQGIIFNCENDNCNTVFNFRIHLGNDVENNTFLANNFYDMLDTNHGEIWKILEYNNSLIIHQKYALYIARIKDKLETNLDIIYVGRGDILDREPDEVLPEQQGYGGNQSQWASVLCKLGYCFIDRNLGKIFIFNGKLAEISTKGLHNWLRDNLQYSNLEIDNPFKYDGLSMVFDETYDRLIISQKQINPLFEYKIIKDDFTNEDINVNEYVKWKGKYYRMALKSVVPDINPQLNTPYYFNLDGNEICGKPIDETDITLFTEVSFTISYSPTLRKGGGGWVCYHDYYPNYMFNSRNEQFAVLNQNNEGKIYKMNVGEVGVYFDQSVVFKTYVDLIYNIQKKYEKYLLSVKWDVDIIDSTQKVLEDKTLTSIMVYNNNQCSGEVDLTHPHFIEKNSRNTKEEWSFNDFRDLVLNKNVIFIDEKRELITSNITNNKAFFDKSMFISKFVVIRLIYNNLDGNRMFLNETKVNTRVGKQTDT